LFTKLRHQWRVLKKSPPGKRFQQRYRSHKHERSSVWLKPVYLVLGTTIFVAGLAMLPAPGPGFLILFVGAGMLAEESLWVAQKLDRLELKGRAIAAPAVRAWERASAAMKTVVVAFGAGLAALSGWCAYLVFTG
jgi:uncharacterized protein (TIGR02611 family)